MDLTEFKQYVTNRNPVEGGSDVHKCMVKYSNEAMKITFELNGRYHTQEEVHSLLAELTGGEIDSSVCLFPPFYADFGKNIHFGKKVFVNSSCFSRIRQES